MTTTQATTAAAATAGTTTASTGAAASQNALQSLSGNFNDFLNLMMTQLQNQDPTSPLDTNQFTSELVQFASVEQQITTNTSLTQLIQLTQGGEMIDGAQMVGKTVDVTSSSLPLQNGSAALTYTATAGQPAEITVKNSAGVTVADQTVTATGTSNAWTWNGRDLNGNQLPDGAYSVAVTGGGSDGATASSLGFTVQGAVTGVQKSGTSVQLELGSMPVDFSALQSLGS